MVTPDVSYELSPFSERNTKVPSPFPVSSWLLLPAPLAKIMSSSTHSGDARTAIFQTIFQQRGDANRSGFASLRTVLPSPLTSWTTTALVFMETPGRVVAMKPPLPSLMSS